MKFILCTGLLAIFILVYYTQIYFIITRVNDSTSQSLLINSLALLIVAGVLSYVLIAILSNDGSGCILKTFKTLFYTKIFLEMCLLARRLDLFDCINVFIVTSSILNVMRSLCRNIILDFYAYKDKLAYFKQTLTLEKYLQKLLKGCDVDDDALVDEIRAIDQSDSRLLFSILCDNNELNEISKPFCRLRRNSHGAFQFQKPINGGNAALPQFEFDQMCGAVTESSISRFFPKDAATILRLIGGFDDSLDFQLFHDGIRQFNIERKNFVTFILENREITSKINIIFWIIYIFAVFSLFIQLYTTNVLLKFIFYPLLLSIFHLSFSHIPNFLYLVCLHPFDIGDKIQIEGENFFVKSFRLTFIVLEKGNNDIVIFTLKSITQKAIKNIRRSKNQKLSLSVDINRRYCNKIKKVEAIMNDFVLDSPGVDSLKIAAGKILDNHQINLRIDIRHTINHQNGYYMWLVQNKVMKKLLATFKVVGIDHNPLDLNLQKSD